MTKKIENILSEFSKTELAFFAKYKLLTYTIETQKVIENWMKREGLTDKEIKKLIRKNEFSKQSKGSKKLCPRCNSNKLLNSQKELHNFDSNESFDETSSQQGIDKEIIKICSICGFNLDRDHEPSKLLKILNKIFGKSKMRILP